MNFFQRRKRLKGVNYLELTPIRRYDHKEGENATVVVLTPRFENAFLHNVFGRMNRQEFVNTKFDELGSDTWLQIDGTKKVSDICTALTEKWGEKIAPCEARVTRYLTQLYLDKFISFKEIEN